ncbi:hypothetical protein SASPL_102945 [Salvia splendens]|uniref:Carbohydrate kinase PfkB domain-containing protein n=1 Tax=Salvia splendens TaxID=180675 RepID=A0A8X9AD95_SALSN|nr:hypothetical protein SASPL_102945 [Salvia splendens]
MGLEIQSDDAIHGAPLILGLQPSALVDHVATVDSSLLSRIPGEAGGSFPVEAEELKFVLSEVNSHFDASPEKGASLKTIAGGSVANTIRGLAAGFGITCGIIGACGDDEEGSLFIENMSSYNINLSRLRLKTGLTAQVSFIAISLYVLIILEAVVKHNLRHGLKSMMQCVCLVDEFGNRTMRPCLSSAVKVQADDLTTSDLRGSRWLVMRYGIFNIEVIQAAIRIAKQEGVLVSLDLASFEMVRKFRLPLLQLLESGGVDLCFANEDEAAELLSDEKADPESALEFLGKHCRWAVVTLGAKGCIAKQGNEVVRIPASGESKAVDATGAGDLFASGFLYGLVKGWTLEECCKTGACSGGSVIRSLGGEVSRENWQWMYKQMRIKGLPVPDHNNFVYDEVMI